MIDFRVIPVLLLRNNSLIKTIQFNKFNYIGDPINTARIFNELQVDEMVILDVLVSKSGGEINYSLLSDLASQCFMPLAYGGGIDTVEKAGKILSSGFEKIIINTAMYNNLDFLTALADKFGSQSIIASLDYKYNIFNKPVIKYRSGSKSFAKYLLTDWAKKVEQAGAGEILLTSIDREGTWSGYDIAIISNVVDAVTIPVIANGGCGSINDITELQSINGLSAAGLSSLVLYQKKGMGVLVNFPETLNQDD